ncbi:hypothetical protein PCLA_03r0446 [Pseudomonas citronellolis]|nr:hypothetical protein PCLA_03r0446 [Pseudomonas citronellolis]
MHRGALRRSELAREWGLPVATVLGARAPSPQPSAARPALKGEGACPCREKEWFQLEITGTAG